MTSQEQTILPSAIKFPGGETYVPVMMKVVRRTEEGTPDEMVLLPVNQPLEMPEDPLQIIFIYMDSRQVKQT